MYLWNMIFTSHDFWHIRKIYNFDQYNLFLVIATNIPQQLKTGFVLQGHILSIVPDEHHVNMVWAI